MFNNNKTILVTGCAGFIGTNFVLYFLETHENINVVNIDLLTYAGNLENLKECKNNPRYRFIKGNICNREHLEFIFKEYDIKGVIHFAAESHVDNTIANFSIISKKVLFSLQSLKEQNRMYPLFVNWVGFKRIEINIEHASRDVGKSSYTLSKLINLAIDSIVSQSNKPLKLLIKFGFLLSSMSFLYAVSLIVEYFMFSQF